MIMYCVELEIKMNKKTPTWVFFLVINDGCCKQPMKNEE